MQRIILIKDPKDVINHMSAYSFSKVIGIRPFEDFDIESGDVIRIPKITDGRVITVRRCVFRFWRKEYLIEQEGDAGFFYSWHNEKKIKYSARDE
jgi:hypothetical protein